MEPKVLFAKYLAKQGYTVKESFFPASGDHRTNLIICRLVVTDKDDNDKSFESLPCTRKRDAESIAYCSVIAAYISNQDMVVPNASQTSDQEPSEESLYQQEKELVRFFRTTYRQKCREMEDITIKIMKHAHEIGSVNPLNNTILIAYDDDEYDNDKLVTLAKAHPLIAKKLIRVRKSPMAVLDD